MKKILLPVFALAAMASCNRNVDYIAKFDETAREMNSESLKVYNDPNLRSEEKEQGLDSIWNLYNPKLYEIATEALEKHTDDSVAVTMVATLFNWNIIDGEQVLELISKLGPVASAEPEIVRISGCVKSVVATAEGKKFIDFSITQPDGTVKSLSQYAGNGKYCLLDMWASWCAPCRRQIPYLRQAHEKFASKGLNVVSVAVWDKPQATLDTAAAHNINWHQIIDAQQIPTDLYGVTGIPQIMLIGPDGTILKRNLGGDEIIAEIKKYL